MQISVLIPTHNYRCYTLVHDLQQQLERENCTYEILVAEDGSKDRVSIISNLRINELPHCRHIIRNENVGRSAIRNYLASEAKGQWLMFLDSDGKVIDADFIHKYLQAARSGHKLICGGITHPSQCPSPEQSLRWKYEKEHELRVGTISHAFRSFAFLISKDVFATNPFDERFRLYGWEDVMFGMQLRQKGIILHTIDAPMMNQDIEPNHLYLKKTEEALRTLHIFKAELSSDVTLLRIIRKLSDKHVLWIIRLSYSVLHRLLRHNLLSTTPSLKAFALYKLGYYLKCE